MARISYVKPHASSFERIAHLQDRGLIVPRPKLAAHKIELIGYERLRIYFLSRRQLALAGSPFNPGTSYKDIIRLYDCDMLLRDVCFAAVGQFELLLRNSMSEALSKSYGSHPYFQIAAFKDASSQVESVRLFADVYLKSKDRRAQHYRDTYSDPALPPIWRMKEFMTFGATSRILQHLSGPIRTTIANDFGIPKDIILTNWVESLVDLRNICAHHDRLFNRKFPKQPTKLVISTHHNKVPSAVSNSLKAILECLDYMLAKRSAAFDVTGKVSAVISRYPEMLPAEAGF